MKARHPRVTITDVAEAAGVSVATVSRALRGFENVSPATAAKVIAVAHELDYQPNRQAALLRTGTSRTITVVVPTLDDWYYSEVIAGAEAVLADNGYDVLVAAASTTDAMNRVVTSVSPGGRADAMILVGTDLTNRQTERIAAWNPAVVVVGNPSTAFPSVSIDETSVGRIAAEHLIGLGHRRIAFVDDRSRSSEMFRPSALWLAGFSAALHDNGLAVQDLLSTDGTATGGERATAQLLSRPSPTAVFCASDILAFGVLSAVRNLGFAVPADLSVMGVDDREIAQVMGLTSIHQPVGEIGAAAAESVMSAIEKDRRTEDVVLRVRLIARASTTQVA